MAKSSLIVLTGVVIFAALTAAGCVNSTPPSSSPSPASSEALIPSLEGTTWALASFMTEQGTINALPNTTITAVFNNGNVTGSSGCNRYFAHYELSGQDNITFTSLGSTVMYCDAPGVMTQETTYALLLQNTTAYTVSADTLSLLSKAGQVQLVFRAANATI